jgi:precorrin-8X/cobalt-precorrin-8 methylmutase
MTPGYSTPDRSTSAPSRPRAGVHPIELESFAILERRVDLSGFEPGAREVVARMIYATADESFATSARIGHHAVEKAVRALQRGGVVVCDSRMVAAGIPGVARTNAVRCYLGRVRHLPPAPAGDPETRSAAAIELAAREHPDGAIWVIGNAPTALARLLDLHGSGDLRPAAVVGLPVGYVGAAESKLRLWESALRDVSVTNEGPRGGSPTAAAALNALAMMARA